MWNFYIHSLTGIVLIPCVSNTYTTTLFFIVRFRKFRGSLKICSKSIIFEPDDNIQPIIKVSSANLKFLGNLRFSLKIFLRKSMYFYNVLQIPLRDCISIKAPEDNETSNPFTRYVNLSYCMCVQLFLKLKHPALQISYLPFRDTSGRFSVVCNQVRPVCNRFLMYKWVR